MKGHKELSSSLQSRAGNHRGLECPAPACKIHLERGWGKSQSQGTAPRQVMDNKRYQLLFPFPSPAEGISEPALEGHWDLPGWLPSHPFPWALLTPTGRQFHCCSRRNLEGSLPSSLRHLGVWASSLEEAHRDFIPAALSKPSFCIHPALQGLSPTQCGC